MENILLDHLYSCNEVTFELDIYIPSMKLAFEYQGIQHYQFSGLFGQPYKCRDHIKKILCEMEGIILIEIPFTWDLQRTR
jgi:hypothetical protein